MLNAIALALFLSSATLMALYGRASRAPRTITVPCVVIILGLSLNLARSIGPDTIGYSASLMPWAAMLSVPFMRRYNLRFAWKLYYHFLLIVSVIALAEYAAVFARIVIPTVLDTSRGQFLRGVVTLFYQLPTGEVYDRLYGVFAEPGTCAMLLLPAIGYAALRRRWGGAFVLVSCLALTRSLGGGVSLAFMGSIYWYQRVRSRWIGLGGVVVMGGIVLALSGRFADAYEAKGASATVRADNARLFVTLGPELIRANPLGLPLRGASLTSLSEGDEQYLGSNFGPYTLFVEGGVLALVGYILFLGVTLAACLRYYSKQQRDRSEFAAAFLSLPPLLLFVVQRQSIFEQALFAFLFAEPVMRMMAPRVTSAHGPDGDSRAGFKVDPISWTPYSPCVRGGAGM